MNSENRRSFLKELSELSRQHRIFIGGCFCCGSPFLIEDEDTKGVYRTSDEGECLEWVDE